MVCHVVIYYWNVLKKIKIICFPQMMHRGICNGFIPQTKSTLVREKLPSNPGPSEWDYSSCIHKFEQYFSNANGDPRIREILDNVLEELSNIQQQNDTRDEILPPNK